MNGCRCFNAEGWNISRKLYNRYVAKKPGDRVSIGDILFDYETDKASFECESTVEGDLIEIFFENGEEVPCLTTVCAVGKMGDDVSALRPRPACCPGDID